MQDGECWQKGDGWASSQYGQWHLHQPVSVIKRGDVTASKSDGEKKLGYNLSDMAGLTVIGLKALDAQLTAQQALIEKLEKRIAELEKKLIPIK